jgi:hypothetical protein
MKTFNDLTFTTLSDGFGIAARMKFDNGYGVSVVKGPYTYGGPNGLYELAVLNSEGEISYNTDITDDVLGHLNENEVTEILNRIQNL